MKDNLLFVNARGLQVLYNACMIALLWVTRGWRAGHWYFDACTITTPPNPRVHWTLRPLAWLKNLFTWGARQ